MTAPLAGASGVILETERLRMRAHRDDDLADLVALAGNWEIARWTGTIPHSCSETDGREWIARVQENHATGQPRRFAIALKETDRLIGGVGLDGSTGDGGDEPALGYWLGQPYWGNGYAREAAAAVIVYGFRTPRPKNDPRLYRPRQRGVAKGSFAVRPETGWRDRAAHANAPRRTACAVISHLAAGASNMSQMPQVNVERPEGMTMGSGTPPKTGWAKLVPELLVSDIATSIEFWCDRLGFKIAYQRPEEKFTYLERPEGAQIMLSQRSGKWETGPLDRPYGRGAMFQVY